MHRFSWLAVLFAMASCFGCGPRNNPIFEKTVAFRGSVVLANGATLPGGRVTFHPQDPTKAEARGMLDRDGRFELGTYKKNDGVMPGAYTVTIEPLVYDQRGNMVRNRSLPIPALYTEPQSSRLTVEVKDESEQEMKFVLR